MTIYHIGVEDIHFIALGSPDVSTTTGFRPEWARCSLATFTGPGNDKRWRAPLIDNPVSTNEFWLTCRMYTAIIVSTKWFRFLSGDGQERLSLHGSSASRPVLKRTDDDETVTTLATGSGIWASGGKIAKIDIYVNLGTGVFKVYSDYALILNATVDLTNGEYTDITGYDLSGDAFWSEAVWRTEDTRKIPGVRTIWPYGDGNAQEWTGTKSDVDEIAVDVSDANYTDTIDRLQQYTIPPLPSGLTGNVVVGAVMLGARMETNPTAEALNIRTGGNDYFSGDFDTGGGIEDHMNIWEQNPDTSAPWTTAEINDAAFNIGVKST